MVLPQDVLGVIHSFCRQDDRFVFTGEELQAHLIEQVQLGEEEHRDLENIKEDLFSSSQLMTLSVYLNVPLSSSAQDPTSSSPFYSRLLSSLAQLLPFHTPLLPLPHLPLVFTPFLQHKALLLYRHLAQDLYDHVQTVFTLGHVVDELPQLFPGLESCPETLAELLMTSLARDKLGKLFVVQGREEKCIKLFEEEQAEGSRRVQLVDYQIAEIKGVLRDLFGQIAEFEERKKVLVEMIMQRYPKGSSGREHYKVLVSRLLFVVRSKRGQCRTLEECLLQLSMSITNRSILSASQAAHSCLRGLVTDRDLEEVDQVGECLEDSAEMDSLMGRRVGMVVDEESVTAATASQKRKRNVMVGTELKKKKSIADDTKDTKEIHRENNVDQNQKSPRKKSFKMSIML